MSVYRFGGSLFSEPFEEKSWMA